MHLLQLIYFHSFFLSHLYFGQGIGDIPTAADAIQYGVDSFDSAFPTRIARHGRAIVTTQGAEAHGHDEEISRRREHRRVPLTSLSNDPLLSSRSFPILLIYLIISLLLYFKTFSF